MNLLLEIGYSEDQVKEAMKQVHNLLYIVANNSRERIT